jgi:hypothetical protein
MPCSEGTGSSLRRVEGIVVAPAPPMRPEDDPLQREIDELWAEHDRFVAGGGDPDEEVDRIAEDVFGSPEATAALLDYLKATWEGRRSAWLDDDDEHHEPE